MPTPILDIPEIAPTQTDKTTTINDMLLAIEGATQDQLAVDMSAGDVTLSTLQYTRYVCFALTGQTTARNLIVPSTKRVFVVRNGGAFDVLVKGATGATVTVGAGAGAIIQNDAVNCNLLGAGAPGAVGATGPAGAISNIVTGAGLSGGPITTATGTITANWQLGTVTAFGAGVTLAAGGSLVATGSGGTVTQVVAGPGLTGGPITGTGTLSALWNAGTVSAVGSNLTLSSGTLAAASGGGTVTQIVAGPGLAGGTIGTTGTIALAAIAGGDLLANTGTTAAVPGATALTALMDAALGSTQGDILYRSGTAWTVLAPGTSGQALVSGGAAANPAWASVGSGTVTQIVAGSGLNGGTITASGTLSALWNAGTVSALGGGLSLSTGTLAATGGGTVTQIVAGSGLTGGTITATGTLALASQPYTIGAFVPGVMTANQLLMLHELPVAVTFPANFGASTSGGTSKAGCGINATASTTVTIDKCPAASDPTVGSNFVNVGSIVIAAAGHAATISSAGGTAVAGAAGDFIRLLGPASADATAANFFATLVGNR